MKSLKEGSWLHDLVVIYNQLGGQASYSDVYQLAQRRRQARGATWTSEATATIRRTVEDHAESSSNYRGDAVFYSVRGHGMGVWALLPEYITPTTPPSDSPAYLEGLEGIAQERRYLLRSRNSKLVEARKLHDDFTCQACNFHLEISEGKCVIEVHHLKPLGELVDATVTTINDLICLCPTCHRIAHTQPKTPLEITAIRALIRRSRAMQPGSQEKIAG